MADSFHCWIRIFDIDLDPGNQDDMDLTGSGSRSTSLSKQKKYTPDTGRRVIVQQKNWRCIVKTFLTKVKNLKVLDLKDHKDYLKDNSYQALPSEDISGSQDLKDD